MIRYKKSVVVEFPNDVEENDIDVVLENVDDGLYDLETEQEGIRVTVNQYWMPA